ncbi:MAG: hypothetical protein KH100_05110 [Dysgonomonas mossii]|uniref:hypothetical protein n=1 Tax=Dysgonomonas mossii TaxID=163665 RepID=UPI001DC98857|nr:hypothetical protein [Dysgonomonas mossii]MBS5797875.1 hypothetical protein [Dysgonomonas mossii]MBS7110564.1 hypothetical protein [Dysgonomonas mossii]
MAIYNLSSIMQEAHKIRRGYKVSMSDALKQAWKIAKVEVRNNAILAARKAAYEAKLAKEVAEYNANYIASPARYYGNGAYNGD